MSRRTSGVVVGLASITGLGVITIAIASSAWNRETDRMVDDLLRTASISGAEAFSLDDLDGLPAPVVRYFDYALPPGQRMIRSARIEHVGEFRGQVDADWSPFRSVQHFTVTPPGFVWDARINMAPLVTVRVRDSYVGGRGGMLAKVAGLVPVVREEGAPHLNSGALHRFFLEGTWFPTALLPTQGVRWEPIDDTSARATLADAGMTLSMVVHFGVQGEIVRVEADRMRDVNGTGVVTPFVGHVRKYEEFEGMMIPVEGEVEWILPEGPLSFWRGTITSAAYDLAP